jgi:hypothetical protein
VYLPFISRRIGPRPAEKQMPVDIGVRPIVPGTTKTNEDRNPQSPRSDDEQALTDKRKKPSLPSRPNVGRRIDTWAASPEPLTIKRWYE